MLYDDHIPPYDWRVNFVYDLMSYDALQRKAQCFDRILSLARELEVISNPDYSPEIIYVIKSSLMVTFLKALNSELVNDVRTKVPVWSSDPDYRIVLCHVPKSSWVWEYVDLKEPETLEEAVEEPFEEEPKRQVQENRY